MHPAELYGPVGYSPVWGILAGSALLVVVIYGAVVLWLTRLPRPETLRRTRARHLRRLADIDRDVRSGAVSCTDGHLRVSSVVRSFVETVSSLPAASMTLSGLRATGPAEVADLVASTYRPAFSGDEELAAESFGAIVDQAREVLASWT